MKKATILVFFSILVHCIIITGCNNTGSDEKDPANTTTWSAGETHVINEDINIEEGTTLIIEPGTVISLETDRSITISGSIDAQGTSSDPIIIKNEESDGNGNLYLDSASSDNNLEHVDFQNTSLTIDSAATLTGCSFSCNDPAPSTPMVNIQSPATEVTFNECLFDGGTDTGNGIAVEGTGTFKLNDCVINNVGNGIYSTAGSGTIELSSCTIDGAENGFQLTGSTHSLIIDNTTITNCSSRGLYTHLSPSVSITNTRVSLCSDGLYFHYSTSGVYTVTIQNVTVTECSNIGVYGSTYSDLSLTNCIITHCREGLRIYNDSAIMNVTTCSITDNTDYGIQFFNVVLESTVNNCNIHSNTLYNVYNNSSANHDCTANWWGTTTVADINASIYDNLDAGTLGTIDYSSYLSSSVTVTGCGW